MILAVESKHLFFGVQKHPPSHHFVSLRIIIEVLYRLFLQFVVMTFNYFWTWTLAANLFFSIVPIMAAVPPRTCLCEIEVQNKRICTLMLSIWHWNRCWWISEKLCDQTLWWLCWKYPSVVSCHLWLCVLCLQEGKKKKNSPEKGSKSFMMDFQFCIPVNT